MKTIKSYTDLEQSKKLAKILPLESADMLYWMGEYITHSYMEGQHKDEQIPIWSLAALFGVLPEGIRLLKATNISSVGDIKYHCDCPKYNIDKWFDNPIDACVAMIERLHELKML